jgi:transcriptional regulator with XRE-family HTH domain
VSGEPLPERSTRAARPLGNEVGQQLRARREERGLSLRELARRIDISPSALSQIETGKSRPSVSTLYAIASEIGLSLDELLGGIARSVPSPATAGDIRAPGAPSSRGVPIVQRSDTRQVIQLESGVRWERLTATPNSQADFLYVVYEPGGSSAQNDGFIRHSGVEYGLVLSGTLEIAVGFDQYELGPGDSISFDSTTPHRLRNTGDVPAVGVWLAVGRDSDPRKRPLDR